MAGEGAVVTSDLDIAELCALIYQDQQTVGWDHFDGGEDDGVCWGVKIVDGVDVVINRGSKTLQDWLRDAEALANPFEHSALGPVHPGFNLGMDRQWSEILSRDRPNRRFGGHSLGAAHASLLTARAVLSGQTPAPRCVFGEPCSTFQHGADVIARAGGSSYRNGDGAHVYDPVTLVPVRFWPELYVHATRMTDVSELPTMSSRDPFDLHHMPLYRQALAKLAA